MSSVMVQNVKPRVTVLMPVYNAAAYLKEAVESILNQTYEDFEFLIINDGSTDNSQSILETFNDKRIRILKNEYNIGLVQTLNKGLQLAQGEYLARMDADDISHPTRLEKQVNFLEQNPTVTLIATLLVLIDEKGFETGYWPEDITYKSINQIKGALPVINCIGHPTVMMKTDPVKNIGYNSSYLKSEDWGLWLNLLSKGYELAKLDEVLLKYRIHGNSTTVLENQKGVEKKIIRFKLLYLKDTLLQRNFNSINLKVLLSLFRNVIKFTAPQVYSLLVKFYSFKTLLLNRKQKIKKVHPVKILKQFITAWFQFSKIKLPAGPLFFFPFYHTGGAEKVHASIIKSVASERPLVFITDVSEGTTFLKIFKENAVLFEVFYLLNFGPTNRWLTKKIYALCEKERSTLFGCNSRYFYSLIPGLPKDAKTIDLLHAFVHEEEDGPEKWSLPIISKLTNRVVINEKTKNDFRTLYANNNVPSAYLDKIVIIPNFVETKDFHPKEKREKLNIIYVGRGSAEKRIHLISAAASLSAQKSLPVIFSFIGEVKEAIPAVDLKYCTLIGEIRDEQALDEIYKNADILIIASSREGFPVVIMEAMARGVIPIATNVGGIAEHIIQEENGFLINAITENEITNQIVHLITCLVSDPKKLDDISANAFMYAQTHFRKDAFFQSYQNLLTK
jgi:glycosyltransferase involved in cell wall biosynthesis